MTNLDPIGQAGLISDQELLEQIAEQWPQLVDIIDNLPNIFLTGRKVNKVPSSYTDVAVSDRENDFNWDASTSSFYVLLDNAGTLEWWSTGLARV